MRCLELVGALWAIVFIAGMGHATGVGHHRHDLKRVTPTLDELLSRLDGNIHEHNKRLQRELPTIHYRTDQPIEHEDGPTIVQEGWNDETHPEVLVDDTSDYVNAAPWTRGPADNPQLQAHDLQQIRLASDNARWVKDNGKCDVPLKKCIPVTAQVSDTSRKFWPRCAILHRCGEDSGCCNSIDNTCAMAEAQNVDLYFYVYEPTRAGVQMMTFSNHTKCSCQPKEESITEPSNPCTCPKHFNAVTTHGVCSCDCADGKSTCRKYKRGKRYFSGTDIRRISINECTEPICEYGPFVLRKRRCTKRRERERYVTERK